MSWLFCCVWLKHTFHGMWDAYKLWEVLSSFFTCTSFFLFLFFVFFLFLFFLSCFFFVFHQKWNKWIGISYSSLKYEQRGESTFLNIKSILFRYKTEKRNDGRTSLIRFDKDLEIIFMSTFSGEIGFLFWIILLSLPFFRLIL